MAEKTAIQQLMDDIDRIFEGTSNYSQEYILNVIRLKCLIRMENEKQQIIDAFNEDLYGGLSSKMKFENGEQYYNETYKK
ncbi:MAG: hypothetical protein ACK6DA_06405 [Candidatus Kapaibacterium sp.]